MAICISGDRPDKTIALIKTFFILENPGPLLRAQMGETGSGP